MMIMALGSCMVLVRQPHRPAIKPAIRVGGASIRPSGLAWGESSFILITQRGYRPAFNADWWLISSDACLVIKVRRGYPAEWLLRGNFSRSRRLG